MANKNVNDMLLAIRQSSNTVRRQVVTDQEVIDRANEAIWSLYDLIDGVHGTAFIKSADFTLVGGDGGHTAPVPSDFYHARALDRFLGTSPGPRVSVPQLPSYAERNNRGQRTYDLVTDNIVVSPPALAAGNYELQYVPTAPQLAQPVVITAVGPKDNCGVYPVQTKTYAIIPNITNGIQGNLETAQKDVLFRWLGQGILATGQWTALRSSTPTTVTPGYWSAFTDIARPATSSGPLSWTLLQRSDGVQMLVSCTLDAPPPGSIEFSITISAGGLFTAGSGGVPPTATDSFTPTVLGTAWLGNNNTSRQYYSHVWQSSDGSTTYSVIQCAGLPQFIFGLARLKDPDPGWTTPVVVFVQYGGNDQTAPSHLVPDIDAMQTSVTVNGNVPGVGNIGCGIALSGLSTLGRVIALWANASNISNKWLTLRSSVFTNSTVGAKSANLGVIADMLWAGVQSAPFSNGGTYTDPGTGNVVIWFNRLVLPWLPGVNPSGITPATIAPLYGTGA